MARSKSAQRRAKKKRSLANQDRLESSNRFSNHEVKRLEFLECKKHKTKRNSNRKRKSIEDRAEFFKHQSQIPSTSKIHRKNGYLKNKKESDKSTMSMDYKSVLLRNRELGTFDPNDVDKSDSDCSGSENEPEDFIQYFSRKLIHRTSTSSNKF